MQSTQCSHEPCTGDAYRSGLCRPHYRQKLAGRPLGPRRIYLANATVSERLRAHSKDEGQCRIWTGATTSQRRDDEMPGQIRINGVCKLAHRVAYELFYGPIPDGLQVDHMCHRPPCINPEHLQLVTNKQNNENIRGARVNSKSGVRGVFWHKGMRKWRATAGHNGKQHVAGYFDNIDDAERAAIALRTELFTNNLIDRRQAIRDDIRAAG